MIQAVKTIMLFASIIVCMFFLSVARLVLMASSSRREYLVSFILHIFGKIFAFILGIKVILSGQKHLLRKKGLFLVSNHLSYIEGIALISLLPLLFIAKADIRRWPFFGLFAFLSSTVFIERTNPLKVSCEIDKMVLHLERKVNLILFPEGTSTNGALFPFKSSFFQVPIRANAPIVPLVIRYKKINSSGIREDNKDLVYWYGDMEFLPHLLKLLKLRNLLLEIHVCKPIFTFHLKEKNASSNRKYVRDECRNSIESYLNLQLVKK